MQQSPPALSQPSDTHANLLAQIVAEAQAQAASEAHAPQPVTPISPSKDSIKQNILRAAILAIGAGMDIDSTARAQHVPGMQEQNSWLYGKHPGYARLIATKTALNAPLLLAAHQIAKEHGSIEGMMPVIFPALVQGIAGGMNYKLIQDQQRHNLGALGTTQSMTPGSNSVGLSFSLGRLGGK